jgi:hypothetical protein
MGFFSLDDVFGHSMLLAPCEKIGIVKSYESTIDKLVVVKLTIAEIEFNCQMPKVDMEHLDNWLKF